jgi:flagellar export protein FliJ
MPFRFSLAPVLKLREALEERELHHLEQTQHQIASVVQLLESLKHEQSSAVLNRESALTKGAPAADLHFHELLRRGMNARQSILEKMLADLQVHRTQQLERYEAAKRNREVLSDLRDRRRAAKESKAAREQQRITDDSFLARSRQG